MPPICLVQVAESRTVLEANEQWNLRAETYRLQGELLWFTDGFDTADRQEAKALLEELS